jgi:hypothetical protein
MTERAFPEYLAIVATIDPDAYASGTQLSDAIDMQDHSQVMFVVELGTIASSAATVNFYVMECATSGGTYTRLSGKNMTALTGSANNDEQIVINVRSDELTSGMRYLKGSLRISAVTDAGMIAIGQPRYSDAVTTTTYGDLASVSEIIV